MELNYCSNFCDRVKSGQGECGVRRKGIGARGHISSKDACLCSRTMVRLAPAALTTALIFATKIKGHLNGGLPTRIGT